MKYVKAEDLVSGFRIFCQFFTLKPKEKEAF